MFELPSEVDLNVRMQGAVGAADHRVARACQNGDDRGRNSLRKDNEYFSLDWRVARPFQVGARYEIIPTLEMFNTFNNANNINPLSTPALFNFTASCEPASAIRGRCSWP